MSAMTAIFSIQFGERVPIDLQRWITWFAIRGVFNPRLMAVETRTLELTLEVADERYDTLTAAANDVAQYIQETRKTTWILISHNHNILFRHGTVGSQ